MTEHEGRVVVVGAGPNGLAAAVELARGGHPTVVYEAMDELGGGTRIAALTLPGWRHDVCSSVHPLAVASPFLRRLRLGERGLQWVHPPAPLAHPFDDGTAAVLERSTAATAATLDAADREAWRRLMDPLVEDFDALVEDVLAPPWHVPKHPLALARFGVQALASASGLARRRFRGRRASALLAGVAAHGSEPLDRAGTAAVGLVLALAGHAVGWPFARGGSARIAEALAAELRAAGGVAACGRRVTSWRELRGASAVLLDLTPAPMLRLAGQDLPPRYRRQLARYRYGPGVFKLDWALSEPIPWRAPECARAGTVHLGGYLEAIAAAGRAVRAGREPLDPLVILAQPTPFDPSRAPPGRHVAWAYIRVPFGSSRDLTEAVEAQVERFAPGFRQTILARRARTAAQLEQYNPNLVGGDIGGGRQCLRQLLFRPALRAVPYSTPVPGLFLCSAATPPGGGVHGMSGYHAARAVERRLQRRRRGGG